MNELTDSYIEVIAIVEGKTEEVFVKSILQPYLGTCEKKIFITAIQANKKGQKGGDIRFERIKRDIGTYLKQRHDTFVTTLVDYYGVREWPGIDKVPNNATPSEIAKIINDATHTAVNQLFAAQRPERRFIPYMAIHEFEALLFSDSASLAAELGINEEKVKAVLDECGEPEAINNNPNTSPSRRLDSLSRRDVFPKVTTGIAVANKIGIPKMRERCPVFHDWLKRLEEIAESANMG